MISVPLPSPIIPRNLPDPFVLAGGQGYYLFATGQADDGRRLPIWFSRDLRNWRFVRGAVTAGEPGAWNRRNFWAPEVLVREGRYWLYYTAMPDDTPGNTGNRVGLAVADRPEGPYEDCGVVVPHASLDGSPFVDTDGSAWLFYTAEFRTAADSMTPGRVYVDRLIEPGRVAGEPAELLGAHEWQEGPVCIRRDGRYLLLFSLGNWGDATYRVCWASSDGLGGPFVESPQPLLVGDDIQIGPGHCNVFAADGATWLVYHAWTPDRAAGRQPCIRRLDWVGGCPVLAR
ncbi:MAG: Extracellular endo-alpha-(1-_5)-L-arabinanase 1 [Phycisphaerae bacterium]|nr:Extracellular endo-alpha-(1->5)-L-arabinanase 1 [Phycisphaerae bacterium]